MKTGFFAYSGTNPKVVTSIETFIKKINSDYTTEIKSWKTLNVAGKLIPSQVLISIEKADYLCADLTTLSDNVFFEIGFAISKNKPIWLILEESNHKAKNRLKQFGLLNTIGYNYFKNSSDLVDLFYKDKIFECPQNIIDDTTELIGKPKEKKPLLFLKNTTNSADNSHIFEAINKHNLEYILDDAFEQEVESFSWYIESILRVPAAIIQFSPTNVSKYSIHNLKCAFISGITLGLGIRTLLLAPHPYNAGIDFKEFTKIYKNKEVCIDILTPFLSKLQNEIGTLLYKIRRRKLEDKKRTNLQKINFGEIVAENERELLLEYFVETGFIKSLKRKKLNLLVGRKGMGKTATLYYLYESLSEEKINHVCLIKPENFELDRLVDLIEKTKQHYVGGYLIEAIWKFLIFTELANTLYDQIKDKAFYSISESENDFLSFIESKDSIFQNDFAIRLEEQLSQLSDLALLKEENVKQKDLLKISEILHDDLIQDLRGWFIDIVPKNHNLILLIDNLDKSWDKRSDVNIVSRYILGLLDVSSKIVRELSLVKSKKTGISFKLTLFLRSDIFKYIIRNAREPDKLEPTILRWDDPEAFFHLIEERFVALNETDVEIEDLWNEYLCKDVNGEPLKDYILQRVIPRPRDIIYFFKQAHETAIMRKHAKITGSDFEKAYEKYSNWVLSAILVENGITITQMESFLYYLAGLPEIIRKSEIIDAMDSAEISTKSPEFVNYFIDHLFSLTVIGKEVSKGDFRFDYGTDDSTKVEILTKKFGSNKYKIHSAFHPYLEITKMN